MKHGLLFLPLLASLAHAQLQWGDRQADLQIGPTETNAVTRFTFTNTGKNPVHMKSLKSSCGSCTTASFDQKECAPGAKGGITVTFNPGELNGLQEKSLAVETDDPVQPVVILTLRVQITRFVNLTPSNLQWRVGETNTPKVVIAEFPAKSPLHVSSAKSDNPKFNAKLRTITDGQSYAITITPADTSAAGTAVITLETDSKDKKYATLTFHAMVRPKATPLKTPASLRKTGSGPSGR